MKKLIIGLLILGLTIQTNAQEVQTEKLTEVVVAAANYKYLSAVGLENVDVSVSLLEQHVAEYDLKKSDLYHEEHGSYIITFFIPKGIVLASYDKKGNLLRTAEKFENVKMPREVIENVAKQYPNWSLEKNNYLVNYYDRSGKITKVYKITLLNGDKRIKVKCDYDGNIL